MPVKTLLRCAAPGILLAALCLLPFLHKAYTIDDPFYLNQARQALRTPLTPAAVEICWDNIGFARPIRGIGPPGLAMAYALVPAMLLGGKEWAGHLTQLLLLWIAVIATVSLAVRCGAAREAMLAGVFLVSFPVVLAMSGNVMPDLLTATLGVIGMERLLAWKVEGKLWQACAAGIALGLAPMARSHAILLLPVGIVMLIGSEDLSPAGSWIGAIRQTVWTRYVPILIALICFAGMTWMTSDHPGISSEIFPGGPNAEQIDPDRILPNLLAFGLNWFTVTPFAIAWLLLDGAGGIIPLGVAMLAGSMLKYVSPDSPLILNILGLAGWLAVGSALLWAFRTRRVPLAALSLCLLIALPMVVYFHLPPKYLVPSAPAASILFVMHLRDEGKSSKLFATALTAILICAGVVVGIGILRGDAEFAGLARRAVNEGVLPRIPPGHRAWYSGQWALTWYAQEAGASCLMSHPPFPQPGDILIAGEMEGGLDLPRKLGYKLNLLDTIQSIEPGVRVMNPAIAAGFYSNGMGYLPWRWSDAPVNTYYVWSIE
jgi:4-amino-4-deoxy-L-arabinose transferase-like glycosyltransferase